MLRDHDRGKLKACGTKFKVSIDCSTIGPFCRDLDCMCNGGSQETWTVYMLGMKRLARFKLLVVPSGAQTRGEALIQWRAAAPAAQTLTVCVMRGGADPLAYCSTCCQNCMIFL